MNFEGERLNRRESGKEERAKYMREGEGREEPRISSQLRDRDSLPKGAYISPYALH